MSPGKYYRIGEIADHAASVKLVCLGIIPGKVIRIIRQAPLGGAYYVSCDDKRLGISAKEIAQLNLVEVAVEENITV